MLGQTLVTIQTGAGGKTVRQVLSERQIARELYLGIVVDRAAAKPVLMVSREGAWRSRKSRAATPELIFKAHFDPQVGLAGYQVRKLCWNRGSPSCRPVSGQVHAGDVPGVRRLRLQSGGDQSAGAHEPR